MIRAVVFDMFETLVSLFEGRTYFGEHIAADAGLDPATFRKEWHSIEHDRSVGKYTIEEGLTIVFKILGVYSEDLVALTAGKRLDCLNDTFSSIPQESIKLLQDLKARGIRIGLITNTFSDEAKCIRESVLFPYFDVALISYEQGICKPDLQLYNEMCKRLGVAPDECLYVGDGGSRELYAAREAGMHPLQCHWFRPMAYEPHIPCPVLEEFPQVHRQEEVLEYLKEEER